MRYLIAALAAVALLPASADAATLIYDDGTPALALQAWVDASFAPVPAGLVMIQRRGCVDSAGVTRSCTWAPGSVIGLQEPDPSNLRVTLLHELGHRFDFLRMNAAARQAFQQTMHISGRWDELRADDLLVELTSPQEQFAEAYGLCARFQALRRTRRIAIYGYAPTPRQHRRVCRLIRLTDRG